MPAMTEDCLHSKMWSMFFFDNLGFCRRSSRPLCLAFVKRLMITNFMQPKEKMHTWRAGDSCEEKRINKMTNQDQTIITFAGTHHSTLWQQCSRAVSGASVMLRGLTTTSCNTERTLRACHFILHAFFFCVWKIFSWGLMDCQVSQIDCLQSQLQKCWKIMRGEHPGHVQTQNATTLRLRQETHHILWEIRHAC